MTMLLKNEWLEDSIREERQRTGAARRDEVWEGVYVVSPEPSNRHHDLADCFQMTLSFIIRGRKLGRVFGNINITDRTERWTQNYRNPDVAVYLNDNPAEDRGTHWLGGPDLALEVISPDEDPYAKLEFYASVNTRELLILHQDPWRLELFRLSDNSPRCLELAGKSTLDTDNVLSSSAVPFTWRLLPGEDRPKVIIVCTLTGQEWTL